MWLQLMVLTYSTGVIVSFLDVIKTFFMFKKLKFFGHVDMFKSKPGMQGYLIRKVIFWPYYFVTEESPIERLSETFFSCYGNPGTRYLGSRGLKNFLNDLIRGKNRHQNYVYKVLSFKLDESCEEFQEGGASR